MALDLATFTGRTAIIDGAWGTQLQAQGLPAGSCPDVWNVENPSAVEAVARSYVQAGSRIILTNTFRSNRFPLGHWNLSARAGELAQRGAAISRKAAGKEGLVFGSMGPTGKIVMMGEVPAEEIYASFAEQAGGLARGGADAILCETFAELDEVLLAVKAARESTPLPVVVSMTYDSGPNKTATMMGNAPGQVAAAVEAAGATAVGANCGAGPEHFVALARLYRQATRLPIWLKPNAGLPVVRNGQTTFPMNPERFAAFGPELVKAGGNFLGGCCGTTPAHIAALAKAVKA